MPETHYHFTKLAELNLHPARRLGRHIKHDPRSRDFPLHHLVEDDAPIVTKVWTRHIPAYNQGDIGDCFPPGTYIRMADGSERLIEHLRLLDQVVTAEGNVGRVLRLMVRDEDRGIVNVKTWGHSHLRMTRNHPVLTRSGYVKAKDLAIGDEIAFTKFLGGNTTHVTVSDHILQASKRLNKGKRWSGVVDRKGLRIDTNEVPEKIELTTDFGRLIGLFLAEGGCDASKVRWNYGAHEKDTLVQETVQLIQNLFGITPHVRENMHNSVIVTLYGTGWSILFKSLCGDHTGRKRLHPCLTSGPRSFLINVMDGWFDGDGCIRQDGGMEGVTISKELALNMFDIAQATGNRPVLAYRKPIQNKYATHRHPAWTITLSSQGSRLRSSEDENHVWRKVREIVVEDYVGPVYNFSVEGDESYVAEGMGVHNCTGNAECGLLMTDPFFTPGRTLVEDNAVALYSLATHLDPIDGQSYPPYDTGSTGLDICKAAVKMNYIKSYHHGFDFKSIQQYLSHNGPVIIGINWYSSFDTPDSKGRVAISPGAEVRGGHETCMAEIHVEDKLFGVWNSWGSDWGDGGKYYLSFSDFERLLSEEGDVTASVK